MKSPACLLLVLLATPALAQAPRPPCIRATDRSDYNARPIGLHEILARNQMGRDRPGVRVMTSCSHIDRTALIGLRSFSLCLAKGDVVAVSTPLGPRETCRVTAISAVPEDYARAEYR